MKRKIDGVVALIFGLMAITVVFIIFVASNSSDENEQKNALDVLSANIMNLEYPYLTGQVKLENGEFKDENSRVSAKISADRYVYGDINNDGKEDAFLIFSVNKGGSGNYVHVASVLDRNSIDPKVSSAFVGDRVIINKIYLEGGLVVLGMMAHAQDDLLCCPSKEKKAYFSVLDGQITEIVK